MKDVCRPRARFFIVDGPWNTGNYSRFAYASNRSLSMAEGSHQSDFAGDISPIDNNCWILTGPTASGKTRIGIELARLLDAEIISLDSMSVYREMDIGTAKPSSDEQAMVPHHLLDIVDPTEQFSLADYVTAAHQVVAEIQQRDRNVLFVGGTPLYLKGLLHGISQGPPADWEFRQQVQEELERAGPSAGRQALHQRLEQVDPLSAHKLHPNDTRRVIRALEVHRVTGQPISHQQLHFEEPTTQPPPVLVLDWPREQLHQRIAERVDWMFAEGLVGEVEGLLDKYGELSRTASQAVGYQEVMDHLQQQVSSEQMIEMVAQRTRQFARRQETWLRSVPECQRVAQLGDVDAVAMAGQLEQLGRQRLAERTAGENPS